MNSNPSELLPSLVRGICPDCDGDRFLQGPEAGLMTNIKCAKCGSEFNYCPPCPMAKGGIAERIGTRHSPTSPLPDDLSKAMRRIELEMIEINQDEFSRTFIADMRFILDAAKRSQGLAQRMRELEETHRETCTQCKKDFDPSLIESGWCIFCIAKDFKQLSREKDELIEKALKSWNVVECHRILRESLAHAKGYGKK